MPVHPHGMRTWRFSWRFRRIHRILNRAPGSERIVKRRLFTTFRESVNSERVIAANTRENEGELNHHDQAKHSAETRFTGLTENCYTTNQSQESTCLTLLRNECCVGYWKAGFNKKEKTWGRTGGSS